MSAITSIVVNDAAATPVAHTFAPARQGLLGQSQIAEYEDRASNSGIPVGFYRIGIDFSRPTKQRKTYRVNLKMMKPVLEVLSNSTVSGILPAPTVSYTPMVDCTFVIPERSNLQDRKDLRKMFYEMLANTQVIAALEQLDAAY